MGVWKYVQSGFNVQGAFDVEWVWPWVPRSPVVEFPRWCCRSVPLSRHESHFALV
jgi:hypothetical protein